MYRSIINIGMLIVIASLLAFGAEPAPLPQDAQAIVDKATKEVSMAETKFLAVKFATLTAVVDKLTDAQAKATKAGKLDAALAIKAQVDAYQKELDAITAAKEKPTAVSTSKAVTLYSQTGFKGQSVTIKQYDQVIDAYKVGFPNDALMSVKLPTGYVLIAYADNAGSGASYEVDGESSDLSGTPAVGMTSFMVKRVQ